MSMMNFKDTVIDQINRLFEAGYTTDYPPLEELLDTFERLEREDEFHARLGEI